MNDKPIDIEKRIETFEKNGYFVSEKFLNKDECNELLRRMLIDWGKEKRSSIHKKDFRIHSPIKLNTFTQSLVDKFVKENKILLKNFFENDIAWLCELSSICVFPNAKRQPIHRDQGSFDKKLISIFINLFDVEENIGPLAVNEGGHKIFNDEDVDINNMIKLTNKAGSYVMMNSLLPHAGFENTSQSSIRPVFYFSIGDPNLIGPEYSISSELIKKIKFNLD